MLSKIGKAFTMNELFNIPCFNGMPFLSAPVIDDWALLPKGKEKQNLNNSAFKERKRNYYE